jgi:hypothetical protein
MIKSRRLGLTGHLASISEEYIHGLVGKIVEATRKIYT